MRRIVLKCLNGIYGWIIGLVLLAAVAYAGYSIWDNTQIYQAAENVQNEVRQLKPSKITKSGPSFDELRTVNKDVVAWLTVDGTNIDYPVLQGKNNESYMDKDVYGKFSLAGSIFLDSRNSSDFSDNYSLIYGHNMDKHLMFGDLAKFKKKNFFKKNTTASIMLPGESRSYKVAAVLQISAGTEEIFNPETWKNNLKGFGQFLKKNSLFYHSDLIAQLISNPDAMEVVSLVTCSDGSTNARTVLILVRDKGDSSTVKKTSSNSSSGSDIKSGSSSSAKKTGDNQNPNFWLAVIAGVLLFILTFESLDRYRNRRRDD